jgi:hypothetical protein
MLPADYPFELRPRTPVPRSPRWLRVAGIAVSLAVHAAVLLRLLAAPMPIQVVPRDYVATADVLEVILLEPKAPATLPFTASLPDPVSAPSTLHPAVRRDAPLRAMAVPRQAEVAADPVQPEVASAAQLFNGIEDAARELTAGDRRLPNAGMPSAIARLPGSADAIVDLPVRFKRRPTPQQVTMFALRILVGTMASNSDDLEQVRTMRNPLQDLTDTHIQGMKDPECNDPEDPLRDPRCYPPPPR